MSKRMKAKKIKLLKQKIAGIACFGLGFWAWHLGGTCLDGDVTAACAIFAVAGLLTFSHSLLIK